MHQHKEENIKAASPTTTPSVTQAEYIADLTLRIWFSDNTCRDVDFAVFLHNHPHPQYDKYAKPLQFRKFSIRNGNIIWGKHADLSFPPEALYAGNLELTC